MNWIPLRKNNVPLVDRQIQKVHELFQKLRKQILEGDLESVEKMSNLKLSIKKRIEEIDKFYNQNCLDERVRFLQKGRIVLSGLLSKVSPQEQEFQLSLPWKHETDRSLPEESTRRSRKTITPKKNQLKNSVEKQKYMPKKTFSKLQNQIQKPQNSSKRSPNNKTPPKIPKSGRKIEAINPKGKQTVEKLNINQVKTKTPRTRRTVTTKQESEVESNTMKKLSELIFTIKMTKEEYHEFVDMKKRVQHHV